jgi:hypothetical protein
MQVPPMPTPLRHPTRQHDPHAISIVSVRFDALCGPPGLVVEPVRKRTPLLGLQIPHPSTPFFRIRRKKPILSS